jgi:hypothetical protein
MPDDLDNILKGWEYNPTDETANVRLALGADGLERIQLRIRFGVLELHSDGTPETGGESILDTTNRELAEHRARKGSDAGFSINDLKTAIISQEIMDYYQRRVCFFLLGDYRRAARDAEHNLDLIRLLKKYSVDQRAVLSHDRYRAFVLMDRARASAMVAVEQDDLDRAMAEIDDAVRAIEEFYKEYSRDDLVEKSNEIEVLKDLKVELRKEYGASMTDSDRLAALREEQARAVAREDYEKAARLRDEIERMERPKSS